jgi:hypothetical protein
LAITREDSVREEVAAPGAPTRRRGRVGALTFLSLPLTLLLFGGLSLVVGQDRNGDQLAYHVPWLWSLFQDQQDLAWSPGGAGALVPSLWNVPWYFAAQAWPPEAVIFYLGVLHGLAFWLVGAIAWTVTAPSGRLRLPLTVVAVVCGFLAPATRTEFGTTFGDLPTAVLVLAALLVAIRGTTGGLSVRAALLIGFLLGGAVGLKMTNAVWLLAALPAVAVTARESIGRRARHLGLILVGSALGALVTAGYWWWLMWDRFGNPLFPFYNGVFGSPYGWIENQRDDRFLVGPLDALLMPVSMAVGGYPSEFEGRDIRWAIIAELAVAALVVWAMRRRRDEHRPQRVTTYDARRFLLTFAIVGWTVWLLQFGVARYLVPLELISGVLLICLVDLVASRVRAKVATVVVLAVICGALVVVPAFQRTTWGDSWFRFDAPEAATQPGTLVVFPTDAPLGHALLGLPDDAIAVQAPAIYRVHGMDQPPRYTSRADDEVRRTIIRHEGPIVSIQPWQRPYQREARHVARLYGMTFDRDACANMRSLYGDFSVCTWAPAG